MRELLESMKHYLEMFRDWSETVKSDLYLKKDNKNIENFLYKKISKEFQDFKTINLISLKNTNECKQYNLDFFEWRKLALDKFKTTQNIYMKFKKLDNFGSVLVSDLIDKNNSDLLRFQKKCVKDLVTLWNDNHLRIDIPYEELETLLTRSFNLIERTYVEFAYSLLDYQIDKYKLDADLFWEDPVIDYILENWWPKRRVYLNNLLLIKIDKFPNKLSFDWFTFMDDDFYGNKIFLFMKTIRNHLTHVKKSRFTDDLFEQLYSKDLMKNWWKINCALALYIICYITTENALNIGDLV